MYSFDEVLKADPEIAQAIVDEQNRQNRSFLICMIYRAEVYLRKIKKL